MTDLTRPSDNGFEGDDEELRLAFTFALVLVLVTGFVDAIGFTRLFGVFPANQTGNIVLFGISVGDGVTGDWWQPGLAMLAFALGVAVAHRGGRRIAARARRPALLTIETLALAVVALLAGDVQQHHHLHGTTEVVVLSVAALAMGMQTVLLGRVAGISVSTTFETGALVRLTETVDDLTGIRSSGAGRRTVLVLASIVVGYAAGAALGTATAREWGGALWVPVVVVAALALVATARARRSRTAS
jgi:uncharacterized membrane protein YoaK (UPF0700 family)